jgi:alkylation response protein AidB-like acyl-CoA dehydrogenase
MDFTLTAEQADIRDAMRALLARECTPSVLRAHIEDPSAADGLWAHLREWVALGDGPLVDLCLVLDELGYVAAPGPFLATVLALPLVRAGDPALADSIAGGAATATVAMAGEDGEWVANTDPVRTFVLEADRADTVAIVLGDGTVAITGAPTGLREVGTLDTTRRVFEIAVPSGAAGHPADIDAWLERATVAVAADQVGTARRILEMSVAYAKERVQFDVPIGSFQAIQHKLADMALSTERATAAVAYAAMAIDADDPDRHRATHVAKAAAGHAAMHCATQGIQTHGGIGYTWEHDLHLFIRRACTTERLLGGTDHHHDRLGALLLG